MTVHGRESLRTIDPQRLGRLLAPCWCEAHLFFVPAHMIRAGETISCGRKECHG